MTSISNEVDAENSSVDDMIDEDEEEEQEASESVRCEGSGDENGLHTPGPLAPGPSSHDSSLDTMM